MADREECKKKVEQMALEGEAIHKKRKLKNQIGETTVVPIEETEVVPVEETEIAPVKKTKVEPIKINDDDSLLQESKKNHKEILDGLESIASVIKAIHSDVIQVLNKIK